MRYAPIPVLGLVAAFGPGPWVRGVAFGGLLLGTTIMAVTGLREAWNGRAGGWFW